MTKDHDGDTESALYRIREIARDMIDADELIQKIKQEDLSDSHMTKRKDLRVTLKPADSEAFQVAKMKAEQEVGYTMRDGEFAARIIQQHVRRSGQC